MMWGFSDCRLLEFNRLPSRTLHRSRWGNYAPVPVLQAIHEIPSFNEVWHRHWSRHILQSLDLYEVPVGDTGDYLLDVALMRPATLAACARRVGTILCAPRLRCAIAGSHVRAVETAVGADTYAMVRYGDQAPHPGIEGAAFDSAEDAISTIDSWGRAALRLAFRNAEPALWLRAELKLPDEVLISLPLDGLQALSLVNWVGEHAGSA